MQMVLMDENFDPEGCLVAVDGAKLVGFILGLVRKLPLNFLGLEPEKGWITSMFVNPDYRRQGIGSQLIERCLVFFRSRERKVVWVSPYTPNYFFPGVDLDAYPEGFNFFQKHGFTTEVEVIGMTGSILDVKVPEEVIAAEESLKAEGVTVQFLEPKYTHAFLNFMEKNFPGDWYRAVREKLMIGAEFDELLIVLNKAKEVIGYCQYEGEHFGPFGVSEELRGRKMGSILFYKTMERMRSKDYRHIWVAWTHGDAARFYERNAGMKQNRRHAIMKKEL